MIIVDPNTGDTSRVPRAEFPLDFDQRHTIPGILRTRVSERAGPKLLGLRILGGLEAAAIGRFSTGLPYSRTNAAGDSILGLPNSSRLPSTYTLDLLLRRPLRIGAARGGLYLDVRNLLNRRNVIAVRRDVGVPEPTDATILSMAEAAYQAHPEEIPFESPNYRPYADIDGNGYVEGREELFPLYLAAARDFTQPLFAYGPPRLLRIGVEFLF